MDRQNLESNAWYSTGSNYSDQITNWGEEVLTYLHYPGRPTLDIGSFPHQLKGDDGNIQSPKRFRTSITVRTPSPK